MLILQAVRVGSREEAIVASKISSSQTDRQEL
ncbi:hypothetical protein Pan153_49150 [Gimesia panareensis]|uniref:Uncharacterized protein n=1 Tax=Gimesia panareensis TaxID=2527978 RepID=A0A517QCV0_9PLAN|nr:hypothetical protein Enr10x_47790 [Gimesia panareensis]QDU52473.1 hypothetical protein Pan110_48520 [Gimesia panareensis]QDV20241.1 hypothetical protein Pan153_49150 [Gimesia panareensis]